MRRVHLVPAVALTVSLVIAGCSDTNDSGGPATSGSSATAVTTQATEPSSPPETTPTTTTPEFDVRPATAADCPPAAPDSFECLTVTVPADYDDPSGPTIALAVTVNRASPDSWRLPVLRGTGSSSHVNWTAVPSPSDAFDSIWIDRRGTGRSAPFPVCPGAVEANADLQLATFTDEFATAMSDCVGAAVDAVPSLESTQDDVTDATDVIAVRNALGIDAWSIAGTLGFFNTVMQVISLDPDGVSAVVAIEPVAGRFGRGPDDAQRGFDAFVAECATRPECSKVGDLDDILRRSLERLGSGVTTSATSPSGAPTVLDSEDLLVGTRFALTDPTIGAALPELLAGAVDGTTDGVIASYFQSTPYAPPPGPTARDVVSWCNDPEWPAVANPDPANPFESIDWRGRCPVADDLVPAVTHSIPSITSDIPVLVVVGGLNSFSSATAATSIFSGFSNITIAVSPGIIEPTSELGPCYRSVRDAFITDPTTPLDIACLTSPATRTLS